jgi:hypothetical protein
MFTELPKLLDRNFAIAFFLPAAAWSLAVWGILAMFGHGTAAEAFLKRDALVGAVLSLILVWLLALLLLALNYPILRLYEGYGRYHPLRWRKAWHQKRFHLEASPVLAVQAGIDEARGRGEEPNVPSDHAKHMLQAVCDFPDTAEFVLPTRFGNLFRAFEVYPRVIYGLDAIPAWPRLQAVMPEHPRKMLADAKAQLDFCVNLSLGGWLMVLLYLGLAVAEWQVTALSTLWIPALALLVAYSGYWLAMNAASNFGGYVKSAFDLYRSELANQLGLELPRSIEAERVMWRIVSRMMIYRSAARTAELTRFRPLRKEDDR